jgi:hypothetical protein
MHRLFTLISHGFQWDFLIFSLYHFFGQFISIYVLDEFCTVVYISKLM